MSEDPKKPGNGSDHAATHADGPGRDDALHPGAGVGDPPPGGRATPSAMPGRDALVWPATLVVVACWCVGALGIGVNTAETLWEWLPVLVLGGAMPVFFLWLTDRILSSRQESPSSPSAKDKESELLEALGERGEVTPITAAMRTSLTADAASRMLEGLTRKGYLRLREEDGVKTYALREVDLRGMPTGAPVASGSWLERAEASRPLDDLLSERELEVLALLASGRTTTEIASELYIAAGTVKTHANNIYRKLGANKRSEALDKARELNLIP